LLEVHAGGEADALGAEYRQLEPVAPIFLPIDYVASLVGVTYEADQQAKILSEVGCVVAHVDGGFEVIRPSWRPDITDKSDLAEEIARIGGYDRIPARLPVAPPGRGLTQNQKFRRNVLQALVGSGHTEVLNYPFLGGEQNRWFAEQSAPAVRLANALQSETSEMRLSLLPGLLDAAARNISRGLTDLAIFEEGSVFLPTSTVTSSDVLPVGNERPAPELLAQLEKQIPVQPRHLAVVLTGNRVAEQVGQRAIAADYQDALAAVRTAVAAVGANPEFVQNEVKGFHPGRSAAVHVAGVQIGVVGEIDPALTTAANLPRRVAAAELNLTALYDVAPKVISANAVHIMPAATQDLSLVVDIDLPAAELQRAIVAASGELLESIVLTDDYRGSNLEAGTKSLTFALRFRAADRTLTQAEVTEVRDQAVASISQNYKVQLRA
jgi:phenylalanyl-tRNA synthetase beta chain